MASEVQEECALLPAEEDSQNDQGGVLLHPQENLLSCSVFPKATAASWSYKLAYQRD